MYYLEGRGGVVIIHGLDARGQVRGDGAVSDVSPRDEDVGRSFGKILEGE